MINYVWAGMMIFSIGVGILNNRVGVMMQECFFACENCAQLVIKITVMMCFWNGILNVAKEAGLTEKTGKFLKPVLRFVLGKNRDRETEEYVASNITANIMGLGNAATPFGLSAIRRMDERICGNDASNEMCRFVILNTASVQLVPSTVFALRSAAGSEDVFCVLIPIWICSALTLVFALVLCKIFEKTKKGRFN